MTDKDLRKLSREDLFKLMLVQGKEVTRQKSAITELQESSAQAQESLERLKEKLNEKDRTIEHLKERLNEKDARLEELTILVEEKEALLQNRQDESEETERLSPMQQEQLLALQNENNSMRLQISSLLEKLDAAEANVENDSLSDLDLLMDEFNAKNTELKEQLDGKERQLAAKEQQLDEALRMVSGQESVQEELRRLRESIESGNMKSADSATIPDELRQQLQDIRNSLTTGGGVSDLGLRERLQEREQQVRVLSEKVDQRDQEIRDLWSKIWTLVAPKG